MRARINKKPDFTREYIDELIAKGGCFSDIVSEFRTTPERVAKRIELLFEHEFMAKIAELQANDHIKNHPSDDAATIAKKIAKKAVASGVDFELPEPKFGTADSSAVSSSIDANVLLSSPESSDAMDSSDKDDFFDFLENNLAEGLEYALRQLEADDAVGETLEEVDTTASRAALKRLEATIKDAEKQVSEAQSKLTAAEVKKTEAEERVERAKEKLRRATLDSHHAAMSLDSAKSTLASEKDKLEKLKKQRDEMQREIDSIELPTFSIVPSGDCIVLKAVNYDTRKMETLEAALKWSRRIGEKFTGLTDSEFAVMGRLFGILSKLKGKFKLDIDPACTNAIAVYKEFEACFS